MMTLFKPWSVPSDLKDDSISWEVAFECHPFDDVKHKLMQNFNIRYECHDAKDDYREQ